MGSRFTGGAQLVSVRMAEQLGDRVVLRAPVRRIDQDAAGARLVSDAGTWRAKRVVVAVPPQLAARIQWNPLLPVAYETLFQRLPMGSLTKAEAIYDRPFWRPALTGMAVNINGGPVRSMFDNSPHDADPSGLAGAPGVLMGFVGGHAWRAWREWQHKPAAERRKAVLEVFAAAVGDQALNPVGYFEQDWAREHWTLGGPTSVAGTGTTMDFGHVIRQPFGRVHWAGAETSPYWNGFMDGAVRSGERAAQEAQELL